MQPLDGYRLQVEFQDGVSGEVDLSTLISSPNAGVFSSLKEPDAFKRAYVEYGVVTWPGNIDLAPDAMYDAIRANGVRIVVP